MENPASKTISRYTALRIIAIIPARGGSKGIPKKNIIDFRGKPLIQWTIEAGLKSKYITDIVVSSDDDKILEKAKIDKRVITLKRPKELAEDSTRTVPVLTHVLNSISDKIFDYLILIQPTSPLRTSVEIDKSFEKLIASDGTSLISVCSTDHHPYKTFRINKNNFLEGIINNEFPLYPRQELPMTFRSNGAIYIVKVSEFLKSKTLLTDRTVPFEMSQEMSLDIDTYSDLKK